LWARQYHGEVLTAELRCLPELLTLII